MPKFMGIHTFQPGAFTQQNIEQLAAAAQKDPAVKGYRSFCNLSQGKAVCIVEAPNQDTVAAWFKKMNLPTDSITKLELEGDRGAIARA
jgi:cytochrome c5